MFKLFIFSLISVALVYQALGGVISGKDDAKNAFQKLMEVVDRAVTVAQTSLNSALVSVKAKGREWENAAKDALNDALNSLRDELDCLVDEAKDKGVDVSKCQNYVDDFANIPNNIIQGVVDCVNQKINKSQDYINDALNDITKLVLDLDSIDGEIDNCSDDKEEGKCYAKIIEEIAKDTKEAPQSISEHVNNATALISDIIDDLETCVVTGLKEAENEAAEDVANFAICVEV